MRVRLNPHIFSLFDQFGVSEHYDVRPAFLRIDRVQLELSEAMCNSQRHDKPQLVLSLPRTAFVPGPLFDVKGESELGLQCLALLEQKVGFLCESG